MSVSENIDFIRSKIDKAASAAGRDVGGIELVAVSKKQPEARIEEALKAGHRVFGENRVAEARTRWLERRMKYRDLRLHLIGPLQTNKVKDAVALFDVIETLDRPKLIHALAEEMSNQGKDLPCFIQVNIGAEDQKAGCAIEDVPMLLEEAFDIGLDIQGLMCIPPVNESPVPYFSLLKKLGQRHQLKSLSMGMSGDFEDAIKLGATHIRIGTALFGARDY